MQQIIKKTVI